LEFVIKPAKGSTHADAGLHDRVISGIDV
jgi:hypothetical protein